MADAFMISAERILTLMCYFAIGYAIARLNVVPVDASKTLSKMLACVICPALSFYNLATNLTRAVLIENAPLILTGLILTLLLIPVTRVLSRKLSSGDESLKEILEYNLLFCNYGYIGIPMVQGVFGDAMLSRYLLYNIPLNAVCYTYGRMVCEGKKKIDFRELTNPLTLAVVFGIAFGVLGIRIPPILSDVLSSTGACMAPISMILAGIVLSRARIGECLKDAGNYLLAGLRLLIIPLCVLGIMYVIRIRGTILLLAGCALCLPFGNNPIIFREAVGLPSEEVAGMTLISYILSLITVPVMFTLYRLASGV